MATTKCMVENTTKTQEVAQTTNTVLMIFPTTFGLNPQTIQSNSFQPQSISEDEKTIRDRAQAEFNQTVEILQAEDVAVVVCPSPENENTPDAIFPNNWVSFHPDMLITYPMMAPNRRKERQPEVVLKVLREKVGYTTETILDLSYLENEGINLEGTGSMVLDRPHKVVFATLSVRTAADALAVFKEETGYEVVPFTSFDKNDKQIYHTNILMSIGTNWAVVAPEAIHDESEREMVLNKLMQLEKEIIPLTLEQVHHYCGNILEVKNKNGEPLIVMSQGAHDAFRPEQLERLHAHGKIVMVDIPTVEEIGGGGARCMLAEVF